MGWWLHTQKRLQRGSQLPHYTERRTKWCTKNIYICLKNALSYSCSPYYHYPQTTRRNSAFRVIDGAAAPLGRRLIAEWIKFEFIQQKKDFIHRVRNTGQLIDLFYWMCFQTRDQSINKYSIDCKPVLCMLALCIRHWRACRLPPRISVCIRNKAHLTFWMF